MSSIADFSVQFNNTQQSAADCVLCNTDFNAANATGYAYATPSFNSNARFGAAISLSQNNNASSPGYGGQSSLLVYPGNIPYLTNSTLGFDFCAFAFNVRAIQETAILAAQKDDGSCSALFSSQCIADIKQTAIVYGASVYNSAQGSGNVTTFCDTMRQTLNKVVPSSCSSVLKDTKTIDFIAAAAPISQQAYTTESVLSKSCTIKNGSETWYNVNTIGNGKIDLSTYDLVTYVVWPVMGMFFPPVGRKINPVINATETTLNCLHINHFTTGSRIPAALPGTTTLNSTTSNTTSTVASSSAATIAADTSSQSNGPPPQIIAGIVVGHLVLLAAIICGIFWCCRRKRKRGVNESSRGAVELQADHEVFADSPDQKHSWHALSEMSPDTYKTELPGSPAAAEMHQHHQYELEAEAAHKELAGDRPVYEMPAYERPAK